MKTLNVNIKEQKVTVNNQDCSFYEAGLYVNDDDQFENGQYPPMKDEDEIKETLIEKHGEDVVIIIEKKVEISKAVLRGTLDEALKQAHNFSMSGWRLPIFLSDDGELEVGGWMSQGSWQPGVDELWSIESWNVEQWYDSNGNEVEKEQLSEKDIEENIEANVDNLIDFHLEGIERSIEQRNAEQQERADMFYAEKIFEEKNNYSNTQKTTVVYQYELVD